MAQEFTARVVAELDTATAEGKLEQFLNEDRKIKVDVEVSQDSSKKLASSIEKGVKDTKINTSSISKQLADSFNITDKSVVSKLKSQINSMITSLGKTWDGKDFDFGKATGFYSGMDDIAKTITSNAKIVQSATGIYDDFYNYFKDKKIYISDKLKNALGGDTYKELLRNGIGNIVRDASKGMSIDSMWSEMTSLFPEHFSADITNQADQILHAFDIVKKAREDMVKTISAADFTSQQRNAISESAYGEVFPIAENLAKTLKTNIATAAEAGKTTLDLDIHVNTDKIMSDIRNAVQSAGNIADEPLNIDIKANEEQLLSGLRGALNKLSSGDEPVKVDIQINRQSLQSDLNAALDGMDLPVHFKVDADSLVGDIRAAVDSITDLEIDLRVNRDSIRDDISNAFNSGEEQVLRIPQSDTSGLTQLQQIMNSVNAAGHQGQSVFQAFGGSLREAFSTFTLANLMEDAIYKIGDAAREGIDTVKEFNDIKTSLAMATGEDKAYIDGLMQSYNELGQELGSVTSDVAESADSWLRQGRTLSETNQLIKDSLVLSKDTNISSEQSSEILTATLNGFQLAADQAGHINDVLTSIDLESASDAGGIGTALTKVASMANNAGVSLEKTAAMIATVKDVTQGSDETVGTAMKSIFSRMNQIRAGKFVDSETGEPLNDVEKVLDKVGISMRDVNDQFKDSESIMDEVAGKWNTFDSMTQKAIATAQAGAHQYNNLIALYDNYDKVQKLTETALNSEGTAEQKFEDNYLTSLEAKTNALKASLESMATSVLSEDMYAGFLDGAKAVTDFITQTDLLKASLAGLGTVGAGFAFGWIGDVIQGFSDLSSAMDILKTGSMTDDIFESLLSLTDGLSESQTRLILSSTALTDAQRAAILMNQGMSQAQAQAAVASMGLATAQGTAAASTATLSGALSGLWATLMANPLILVAAGVTAAVAAFSAFNNAAKEAVSSARESMGEWDENNNSIQDNIDKITQLRTELASGTLSEQEAAQAKSDLLSIQESLTESYGNQVEGIDLLNGSLEQQINLLDKVSQKEAQRSLNENKKGIEKAQKEMEKDRHTYLGQFYDNGSEESEAVKKSIQRLQKEYGKEVFDIQKGADGITMDIHFNADAAQAKEALNDFMTDVSKIEEQYGQSDTLDLMSTYASEGLKEANKVLEEYQDLYNQAAEAELIADENLFKSGNKEQTAAKWISDYAKAIEEYNNALSEGDDSKISEAASQFGEIDSAINSLTKNTGMSEYADQIAEVREQLNDTAVSANNFRKAVEGQDSSDFGKSVAENVKALKELGMSDTDFKYAFETDGIQEGEDAVQELVNAAIECGVISDTSSEQVNGLVNMLAQLGVISSTAAAGVDTVSDAAEGLTDNIAQSQDILSGISAATSLITSQSTGRSISIDDFNSEELEDYTSALEYNNGTLQLNADKVRELQKAKAEEAIQTNDNLKLEKQAQYMENIAEIERYQEELRKLTDAKGENAQAIQESIDSLLTENDSLVNQCAQLDLLSASLREATGAYQNWLDKQNTSESGDMFDDALGAMQHIDEVTQDTDSEYYGRIGRESYQAAVEFIVPDSIDSADTEAVQSYMDSIEHYFLHDGDGNRTGLDVAEFCQKAMDQGLMVLDEASGQYQIAGQKTMEDFANGLNLSMPLVQAMFGEMEEFGGEYSWANEAVQTFGDLGMAAGEAKARIEEASGSEGIDIQIDVSDIDTTEDKISALENTISQMQDYRSTLEVDSSQVDDANTIIAYCVKQKQMLSQPTIMSVDTSQVDGEISTAISLLQQFQEAQNNLELQAAIGADTSEAQAEVDGLVGQIQGLTPEIKALLSIDSTSAAAIAASVEGITPEILVHAGVDSAEVDAYAAEEKNSSGIVTWGNDTGVVDAWAAQMHTSSGTVNWGNDVSQVKTSFTATGTVNWINATPPSGTHGVNGTAHAGGTAHYPHLVGHAQARGNWGTKTGGITLVGELGREIVVDPNTGTWHTVGDNGAEFTNIPKGSIVFNHLQTEALLERGFVAGRGKARVNGSAMVTGGISVKQANIASGRTTYSPSSNNTTRTNTSAQKANTSATKGNTKATNDNTEAAEESISVYDWVARRLEYFSQKVKAIADTITDFISPMKKASLLYKQVDAVNSEMQVNYRAARAYYDKAQSLGLDMKTRKLVEEGKYSIEDIDTSTDAGKKRYDLITEYEKYYNEYVKCIDTVRELRTEQVELFKQWADMPTEAAEKKIEKLEQSFNGLTAIEARLSAADLGGSTQAALVKQMTQMKTATENSFRSAYNTLKPLQEREKKAAQTNETNQDLLKTATNQLKKGVTLTANEKSRIASGQALSTKGLTGRKKTLVTKYNNALKKANASQTNYNSVHAQANQARKTYTAAKTAMTEYQKQYNTAMKYYNAGNSLSYQNYLVDAQLANTKQQNEAYQTAYQQAMKNTQTATTRKTAASKTLTSVKNRGKNYAQRYAKYLTASQRKQLANGQKINTTGIKNKNLLNILNRYNVDLQNAINSYTAATQQLTAAQESEAEAAANAAQSQAEYAQAQIEAEQKKFENIENYYNKRIEYQKALAEVQEQERELSESHGNYTKSTDYNAQIKAAQEAQKLQQEAAKKMQEQLDKSVKSGVIKQNSDEWLEMKTQIIEAENAARDYNTQIENLKQEQILTLYAEMFDRAIEKADRFIDKFNAINQLMTDEMMYDYDTGYLTEFGALAVTLNAKELNTSLDNIALYVKKRQQIIDDYNKGSFGQEKYDELMKENDASLQSAISNANSYRQAIISIIKEQAQAEQDALFKVIDARKEALKKKKEYYDYDKKLKSQTKEINLLQQQIAALDGVTDAESRAQKARLEAQLKEQQDDLDDTVRDHVYELQIDGLDDLQDQLSEDFDEWAYNLSASVDKMSQAISEAVNNVGGSTTDALNSIAEILKQFGITPEQIGISASDVDVSGMKHYAGGTNKVKRKEVAFTNENGRELITTKDGIITQLYPGDGVIANEFTDTLVKMASQFARDGFVGGINIPAPEVIMKNQMIPNININYGGLTVQGDLVRDTLPDLQTILKKASAQAQKDITRDLMMSR